MKQLNNSSTPKGRKVFTRRILFFLFLILAVIASILALYLKRTVDQERKQDKIEEEITTEKEKDGVGNLHKKYKDMIGWLEIKGRQALKVIIRMTGSIIFTGMCMESTAFMERLFWMLAALLKVTT